MNAIYRISKRYVNLDAIIFLTSVKHAAGQYQELSVFMMFIARIILAKCWR